MPPLPASLQELVCGEWHPSQARLPPLPSSLRRLFISQGPCTSMWGECTCGSAREEGQCGNCTCLEHLPPLAGSSIQILECVHCPELRQLPSLPSTLRRLTCINCFELRELPQLPPSLRELECINCTQLQELPPLPASLTRLETFRGWGHHRHRHSGRESR